MGFVHKKTVTAGLPTQMADWLRYKTEKTGIPLGRLVQNAIEETYGDEIKQWEQEQTE